MEGPPVGSGGEDITWPDQVAPRGRKASSTHKIKPQTSNLYLVRSVLHHRYRQGWRFLTLWEGFGVEEATWEPFSAFVLPEGRLNSVLVDYLSQNNLGELLRLAETLASKTKARD